MKELVVISGKGGTGKTSIVASFAALARGAVFADCDVDAADLHLVLEPKIIKQEDFSGGKQAIIDSASCTSCGKCQELCRFAAITLCSSGNDPAHKTYRIDPISCEGCGVCVWFCPTNAIEFSSVVNGQWFLSETRHGPMVHAELRMAEENSGKLVSLVRAQAKAEAERLGLEFILIDGSPGIGCPVIASITGADLVLIVTEPTLSGLHDMERVADVAKHFGIPAALCVNKWDINSEITEQIEQTAISRGLTVVGRIRYDRGVTDSQMRKLAVVEYQNSGCAEDIHAVWQQLSLMLSLGY